MSELLVNTIKKADGTGSITVPANTGTLVDTSGATFTGAVTGTNLTLSGGVYLGGTGSANYLDDYEEGSWTPTVSAGTISVLKANYVKIGAIVHIILYINLSSVTTDEITGLPFPVRFNSWAPGSGQGNSGNFYNLRAKSNSTSLENKNFSDTSISLSSWGSFLIYQATYETSS